MNLQKLCVEVVDVAKKVGVFIGGEAGKVSSQDIVEKYKNNLVSYVDIEAEKQIVTGLKKLLPSAGFIAEEGTTEASKNDWQWIIDPLDGTSNFLHDMPVYAVSIALTHKGLLVLGVVYEINRKECFYAWKDGGAHMNNQPIKVSKTSTLKEGFVATGFPYYDFSKADSYMEVLKYFVFNTSSVRRLGAASVDLCYVACGRFDGYFEHSLSAWDVAAGSLIVQEAGGIISDFSGGEDYLFGKEIVASNRLLCDDFFGIIEQHLGKKKVKC